MRRDFPSAAALTKIENDRKIDKLVGQIRNIHADALPIELKAN